MLIFQYSFFGENIMLEVSQNLKMLRQHFVESGFDIRFVGGCVRDFLCGIPAKDIDLCSDATPDEQVAIYKNYGISYHETGLQHGTITVVMDGEVYEITSLRIDTNHDGRHAVVHYTKDWIADLGRRDLTINAIEMTFDGEIIDPFDGQTDLINKHVQFVGNPSDRMGEDYLRILRWLRFHGRFAPDCSLDQETSKAAVANATGLRGISRERVWMEVSKIISGEGAADLMRSMYDLGIAEHIGMPAMNSLNDLELVRNDTRNPVTLMFALLGGDAMENIATDWKWSSEERDFGLFLAKMTNFENQYIIHHNWPVWLVAYHNHPKHWVAEMMRIIIGKSAGDAFMDSEVPVFPVAGRDLLEKGILAGKQVGYMLKGLKLEWAESGFIMNKEELMVRV